MFTANVEELHLRGKNNTKLLLVKSTRLSRPVKDTTRNDNQKIGTRSANNQSVILFLATFSSSELVVFHSGSPVLYLHQCVLSSYVDFIYLLFIHSIVFLYYSCSISLSELLFLRLLLIGVWLVSPGCRLPALPRPLHTCNCLSSSASKFTPAPQMRRYRVICGAKCSLLEKSALALGFLSLGLTFLYFHFINLIKKNQSCPPVSFLLCHSKLQKLQQWG